MNMKVHTFFFKSPAQPFPTVETHLNMVGEPSLQTYVHEAELAVIKVKIQMLALCLIIPQLWKTRLFAIHSPIR